MAMSLFNETVARLTKAENDLAVANRKIADLERALKNSRAVNLQMLKAAGKELADGVPPRSRLFPESRGRYSLPPDLGTALSDDQVEQMFARHTVENSRPRKQRFVMGVISKACALLGRKPATVEGLRK